jgi:hypothetical protein
MIRTILLTLTIWLLAVSAQATILYTNQSGGAVTIQTLNPAGLDTVIVEDDDTLLIATTWHAGAIDTTAMAVYVRNDGLIQWSGDSARANFGALWLGGLSGAPWDTLNGGNLEMGPGDTLALYNSNILGADDLHFEGPTCTLTITGTSADKAVVMGMSASDRPYILTDEATGVFNVQYAKFYRLGSAAATPGITLGTDGNRRDGADGYIRYSVLDSCSFRFYGDGATVMESCSLYIGRGWLDEDMVSLYGRADTVKDCYIEYDNDNQPTDEEQFACRVNADSTVLTGNTWRCVNIDGPNEASCQYGIRTYANNLKILGDTIDSYVWGFTSTGGKHTILFDQCVVINNLHEGILKNSGNGDSAYTIQRCVFYGNSITGIGGYAGAMIEFASGDKAYADVKLLYNTFCECDTGEHPIKITNHTGGTFDIDGLFLVGNICIGRVGNVSGDIRIGEATNVLNATFREFKNNAFDSLCIWSGNSMTIYGDAYTVADSNLNTQTSYGFVDSVNFDLRLTEGSPMRGAGDITYGAQVFGGSGPFDIGYWQFPDEGLRLKQGRLRCVKF